jgi:ribose-phosphate pyrophosphokinase
MEKRRSEGVVSGEAVVGDIDGKTAIILDDLVSSGTTLARAAAACQALGAKRVFAAASHGVFAGAAAEVLADPALEKLLVADSIPPFRLPPAMLGRQVEVLDSAPLFAEAIRRLHSGGSLVELMGE